MDWKRWRNSSKPAAIFQIMLSQSKLLDITLQYLYILVHLLSTWLDISSNKLSHWNRHPFNRPNKCMQKCNFDRLIVVNGPTSRKEQERNRNRHIEQSFKIPTMHIFCFSFLFFSFRFHSSFALFRLCFWSLGFTFPYTCWVKGKVLRSVRK